jgi:hypothetical protein
MYNTPKFIELHSNDVDGMINIQSINCIARHTDEVTLVYVQHRDKPLYVDESYEEIKKRLSNFAWFT